MRNAARLRIGIRNAKLGAGDEGALALTAWYWVSAITIIRNGRRLDPLLGLLSWQSQRSGGRTITQKIWRSRGDFDIYFAHHEFENIASQATRLGFSRFRLRDDKSGCFANQSLICAAPNPMVKSQSVLGKYQVRFARYL